MRLIHPVEILRAITDRLEQNHSIRPDDVIVRYARVRKALVRFAMRICCHGINANGVRAVEVKSKTYQEHRVFAELGRYADFYEQLATSGVY